MSGIILVQCCLGYYLIETMRILLTILKIHAARFTVFILIFTSAVYSIFTRSEYTLAVVLSVLVVSMVRLLYGIGQAMNVPPYGPFATTWFGRLFAALEHEVDDFEDDDEPSFGSYKLSTR
jgi:hypothetical protein